MVHSITHTHPVADLKSIETYSRQFLVTGLLQQCQSGPHGKNGSMTFITESDCFLFVNVLLTGQTLEDFSLTSSEN